MKQVQKQVKESYKRKPFSQLRLDPELFRQLQILARRNCRTAPLELHAQLREIMASAGIDEKTQE